MRKIIVIASFFSFFMTLLYALIFGETVMGSFYFIMGCTLIPCSAAFALYIMQHQSRIENEALTFFSTAVTAAATTQEIDRILLNEVRNLIPASAYAGILELMPFSDRIDLRSGICGELSSVSWLQFEKQTEDLIELYDQLFIRLCNRGGRTLFLVVQKKRHFLFAFRIKKQRFRSLRAVVRTAYEKQFLVEGLTNELEDVLKESPHASAKLTRLAFELAERERSRLALDLHDTALQDQLFWHRHILELLESDKIPADIRSELAEVSEGMLDVVYRIREICTDLKPRIEASRISPNKGEGVISIFDELIQKTRLRSDFDVQFDLSGFNSHLTRDELLILYRIVQELLHNAAKHSKAKHVSLTLENSCGLVLLRYSDDGIGVKIDDRSQVSTGMGLAGIRERSRGLAGRISFNSVPGQGFHFELHFRPFERS